MRGMQPTSDVPRTPIILKDLPEEVCPYANMDALKPLNAVFTMSRPV